MLGDFEHYLAQNHTHKNNTKKYPSLFNSKQCLELCKLIYQPILSTQSSTTHQYEKIKLGDKNSSDDQFLHCQESQYQQLPQEKCPQLLKENDDKVQKKQEQKEVDHMVQSNSFKKRPQMTLNIPKQKKILKLTKQFSKKLNKKPRNRGRPMKIDSKIITNFITLLNQKLKQKLKKLRLKHQIPINKSNIGVVYNQYPNPAKKILIQTLQSYHYDYQGKRKKLTLLSQRKKYQRLRDQHLESQKMLQIIQFAKSLNS